MSRASIRRATRSSELGKLMRRAAGRHQLWDVFSDFCEMGAISIANAVDLGPARAGREQRYLDRIKRYEPAEQALFPQMLAALVDRLEEGASDVLGALFGELELGNSDRGQFFTPFEVCRLMAGIQIGEKGLDGPIAERGFVTLMEPACGAGAMVIAFADEMRRAGCNPQQQLHATCQDIDSRGVHMTYLQLSLLHVPAVVILGNTLAVERREVWYTPAHILGGWNWRLRRPAGAANDNEPQAVADAPSEPPRPPTPLGEQIALF